MAIALETHTPGTCLTSTPGPPPAATGSRHLLCLVEGGGDRVRALENIARLGGEVLPEVRWHAAGLAGQAPA